MGITDEVVSAGTSVLVLKALFGAATPKQKKESPSSKKQGKSGWRL